MREASADVGFQKAKGQDVLVDSKSPRRSEGTEPECFLLGVGVNSIPGVLSVTKSGQETDHSRH